MSERVSQLFQHWFKEMVNFHCAMNIPYMIFESLHLKYSFWEYYCPITAFPTTLTKSQIGPRLMCSQLLKKFTYSDLTKGL